MKYQNVCIESFGYVLPDETVSSMEIEARLEPLYQRLGLSPGLLEGMYGIRERRFWPVGTRPSEISIQSATKAIEAAGLDRSQIGALVHGSVSRDFLEPATACVVHHGLALSSACVAYDVSNACLGILNGMVQIAGMIELGQIRAGIVVGTECSRTLVENTIAWLNKNDALSLAQVNSAVASLTIGSGSVAVLLTDRLLSRNDNRLLAATTATYSAGYSRCQIEFDETKPGEQFRFMETDAARLIEEGILLLVENFGRILDEIGWSRGDIDKTICHQVGSRPQRLGLESLQLDPARDFTTYQTLGNTAAVALPITMAMAGERQFLTPSSRVALIGLGSGINSIILGVDWQDARSSLRA
jgi:3-oxoacyl-[acyl-carrier-protein] synthase-3